jgi:hypothetical protein
MVKQLDKFCSKYYNLVGLPFRFDNGVYLKKNNSDGSITIIDLTKKDKVTNG